MKLKNQSGFTIYELMITMLIIGIILTIGVPNLSEFTQNSRLTSTSNDLHSSFQLARSEAARAKSNITICASVNSLDPAAACGGTFNDGWIIFVDTNGDLVRDAGENILRAHPPVASGVTVTTNGGSNYFSFAGTGLGRGDIGGNPSLSTAMICDDRGIDDAPGGRATARRMVATPIGRATIISDKAMILAAGGVCP
ncbi:MAG: type IV fimbrial biogenesis protein FimT [Woeseiaceae bacterium]|jgi:type IV fimbrial biogenesis protein FimT